MLKRKAGAGCLPVLHQSKRRGRGGWGWEGAEEEGSCEQPSHWPCVNLGKFAQGNTDTFAFAFQLKCGNSHRRSSAKPASSQLETTFFLFVSVCY